MHVQSTQRPGRQERRHPTLGGNLYWWRLTRRLSHRELGARAGLAYRSVGAWETGERDPSYDEACRLAEALEIPVQYLWDHVPAPLSPPPPLELGRKPKRHAKVQVTRT